MFTRIMTSVIGIPLVIAIIVIGNPWLQYVIMGVSLIAMYEIYHVIKKSHKPIVLLGYVAVIMHYLAFDFVMAHYYIYITLVTMSALRSTFCLHNMAKVSIPSSTQILHCAIG